MSTSLRILIVILFLFKQIFAEEIKKVSLRAPDLSDENIIGYNVGLRPYRYGGIRLETERVNDTLIIHDYGHGGGGLSLSFGCAKYSLELLLNETKKDRTLCKEHDVAVIGCGVIGMVTAHLLKNAGYDVTIYAAEFPPHTTSNIAAGLWGPLGVDQGKTPEDQALFMKLAKDSYDEFKRIADDSCPRFKGIKLMDFYCIEGRTKDVKRFSGPILDPAEEVEIKFDTGITKRGLRVKNILMDGSVWIHDLFLQLQQRGLKLVQKMFNNLREVSVLKQRVVFNCTGLGARNLCDDDNMVPVRGQLVYLRPQKQVDYLLCARKIAKGRSTMLVPLNDRFVVGSTFEIGEENCIGVKEKYQNILKDNRSVFQIIDPGKGLEER